MRIDIENIANRLLPASAASRLQPAFKVADGILNGEDDHARAQRMALMVFTIRVVSAVIAFASQVMLARWLGTFEYGIFVGVWVTLIVASTLASAGFPAAVTRLVAEYRQKNQPPLVRGSIRASMVISLIFSFLIASIGALILQAYPELIKEYYIVPIYLAFVCLPMLCVEGVMDGTCRAFNWPLIGFIPTYIVRPLAIILILGLALLMGYEANAETAMWAGVFSCYITTFFQFLVLAKKIPEEVPTSDHEYKIKQWVIIAFPLLLVEGFYMLQTSVDIILVSIYISPEDTAVYFAATKILALIHFVYFAVRASVAHRFTAFHQSGDLAGFRDFVQKTVTWTFWPSLLLAVVMALLGKYILMLFGTEFTSGTHLLWILILGIVIRSSVGPAESLLSMADGQNICAAIYALALVVNVSLNLSLIPSMGLTGAALATTIAMTFESVALYAIVKRRLSIHAFIIPQRRVVSESAT